MANKKGSKKLAIFLSEEEIDILKQDTKLRHVSLHEYNIVTSLTYGRYDKYALPHQNLDLCMNNLHVIENYREIVENNIIENIVK